MTEPPADTLIRAAAQLRRLAAAVRRDLDTNQYWACAECGGHAPHDTTEAEIYGHGVNEGLGGPAGALAAAFTPGAADALARLWDAIADQMGDGEVVETALGEIGLLVVGRIFAPRPTWTAAIKAARASLGEN